MYLLGAHILFKILNVNITVGTWTMGSLTTV